MYLVKPNTITMKSQKNENLSIFKLLKKNKFKSINAIVLALALLNLTVGCSYYNVKKVRTTPETMPEHIQSFNQQNKYIILHDKGQTWHLTDITISEDDLTLTGTVNVVDSGHIHNELDTNKSSYRYKKAKSFPLNEVHFFMSKSLDLNVGENIIIPFNDIEKITINNRDSAREVMSWIGGTIGIALVLAVVVVAIASCPFIYVKDGNTYQFAGELYPGIITPNLQKDDFIKLPFVDISDNEYTIQITNELKEIQNTDLAKLIVIDHNKNLQVLLDKNGIPHTFNNILKPINVIVDDDLENSEPALEKDYNYYGFNSISNDLDLTRNIQVDFENPENLNCGKIILTVKNSIWLDYAYGKFNAQFGSYFNKFQSQIQDEPAEKSLEWTNNQHVPLSVYIMKNNNWTLLDKVSTVGALAYRDIVIPFDIDGIESDNIKIKLETGFMFWDLDYIGIDYSENEIVEISYVNPFEAIDENGNDVTSLLSDADQKYLIQPEIGNKVDVTYKLDGINNNNLSRSVFLMNRGYYNYIRDYKGRPDIKLLKSFKEKESFTNFSIQKYDEIIDAEINFFSNLVQ